MFIKVLIVVITKSGIEGANQSVLATFVYSVFIVISRWLKQGDATSKDHIDMETRYLSFIDIG